MRMGGFFAEQLRLFTAALAELLDNQKDAAHCQAHTNGLGESAGADLRLTRQHLEGIGVKEEKCGNRYRSRGIAIFSFFISSPLRSEQYTPLCVPPT